MKDSVISDARRKEISVTSYMESIYEIVKKIEQKGIHNLKMGIGDGDDVFNTDTKTSRMLVDEPDLKEDVLLPKVEDCEDFLREHLGTFIVSLDRKYNKESNDWSGYIIFETMKYGITDGEDLKVVETPYTDLRRAMVYLVSELV